MGRKKHEVHEEHENHERWLVSYADFITLLFAFFVILFALSQSASAKIAAIKKAAESMKAALDGSDSSRFVVVAGGNPGRGKGDSAKKAEEFEAKETREMAQKAVEDAMNRKKSEAAAERAEKHDRARKRLEAKLARFMTDKSAPVAVVSDGKRLAVRLQANSFFDAGSADLRPDATRVLDAVGAELAALGRPIRVEGHTDDRKPSNGLFNSNWQLSASRAVKVTEFLIDGNRVAKELLTAAGLADTRPLADNEKEQGREVNRRIELVVSVMSDDNLDDLVP